MLLRDGKRASQLKSSNPSNFDSLALLPSTSNIHFTLFPNKYYLINLFLYRELFLPQPPGTPWEIT